MSHGMLTSKQWCLLADVFMTTSMVAAQDHVTQTRNQRFPKRGLRRPPALLAVRLGLAQAPDKVPFGAKLGTLVRWGRAAEVRLA